MLSDCLWRQVQPTRAEVERVATFCLRRLTPASGRRPVRRTGTGGPPTSAYANSSGTQLGARFSMNASIPSRGSVDSARAQNIVW